VALQAKGAAPRKQHYVPQFYLRKFTGAKDMLLVFDRDKKETYRSKPLGIAAQRDFNRIDVEGMDANAVEKVLSEFEGETAPHLDRIIANKSIADQGDRSAMVNLMAAMTLRNPKRRQAMGEVIGNFAKNFFSRKENYDKYVADMKKVGKEPEFTLEELRSERQSRSPKSRLLLRRSINTTIRPSCSGTRSGRPWSLLITQAGL